MPSLELQIPKIGVGTDKLKEKESICSVLDEAFKLGIYLVDTAQCYKNEKTISDCLPNLMTKHKLAREDLFIVSKISPANQGFDKAIVSTETSADYFQYLDAMLIHWPGSAKTNPSDEKNMTQRFETWKALEDLYQKGKVKSIGVSNYTVKHLVELLDHCTIKPHVVQNEFHPRFSDRKVLELCNQHAIKFMAYSPFGRGDLIDNPVIATIAKKHTVPPSQVLLKWSLQNGCIVIPKTSQRSRVKENFLDLDTFELDGEDLSQISTLQDNHKYCWDPETIS